MLGPNFYHRWIKFSELIWAVLFLLYSWASFKNLILFSISVFLLALLVFVSVLLDYMGSSYRFKVSIFTWFFIFNFYLVSIFYNYFILDVGSQVLTAIIPLGVSFLYCCYFWKLLKKS